MKKWLYLMLATLLQLTACDVHEWPGEVELTEEYFTIYLDFDTDMDEQEFFYDARSSELIADYEMRYTLKAFPYESHGRKAGSGETAHPRQVYRV